jgi:hypothetical protein
VARFSRGQALLELVRHENRQPHARDQIVGDAAEHLFPPPQSATEAGASPLAIPKPPV